MKASKENQSQRWPLNKAYSYSLRIVTQFKQWNIHQVRWFGAPCPNLGLLGSIFCLKEQLWLEPSMWNFYGRNWNCICTFISVPFSCMTELRATDQRLCRISWQKSKFQPWIGLGTALSNNPIENLWEIVKKKVADKQPSSIESLKEANKGSLDKGNICRVLQQPDSEHATPNPSSDQKQRRACKILTSKYAMNLREDIVRS